MSDLIGDLQNPSNQLVLAAMVAVCLMYFVVQLLRSTASRLINEVRTESAIIEAQYMYRAVWSMVHLSMCLSLGVVTLQQARLQSVKHLAIENGVVNAMTISNQGISGEAYERLGGLVAGTAPDGVAECRDAAEVVYTTASGSTVSWIGRRSTARDTGMLGGGSESRRSGCGIPSGIAVAPIRSDGIDTLPVSGHNGRHVF